MSYIGNQPTTVAFLTDQFSGNGSTTAFTMSVAPATTSSILVAITGVVQDPSTYSVAGTTLTFSAAPPSGTGNISVRYLGIPASGVTTTAYRTITEFTATASQTTFSVPSYTVGYINVYRNGVRLGTADFTASDGTSVVLAAACTAGDLVTTESFYVSSVLNAIPATAGAVNSTYVADSAITPTKLSQPFTSGTSVASTSGTSIDFTSIPSWVRRITVMFAGVSISGSSNPQIQIGSGSVATTGYASTAITAASGPSIYSVNSYTAGFVLTASIGAGTIFAGSVTLTLLNSSTNIWVSNGNLSYTNSEYSNVSAGTKTLSGTLDRVRITMANGTDTFDAGSINILYE